MAAESPANGVSTTLAASILSTDTTCSLTSATGFTNAQYHCLLSDGANSEIVTATALSGTTLTITRASETWGGSATAYAFAAGAKITIVATVQSVQNLINQTPPTLTYYAAITGTTIDLSPGTGVNIFTVTLPVGTYVVHAWMEANPAANLAVVSTLIMSLVAGTATITFTGTPQLAVTWPSTALASEGRSIAFAPVITVTAAGTLLINANWSTTGTVHGQLNGNFYGSGYTIIKIA